ncbi:hypothetical protein J437_LFUL008677 [Ladona fulva]|uniref:Uncharacterized protein n=1 Tax=Ladona fulva TaxID=123851 RepID=A0A8K0KA44_LADFU|nr:hypothetical protein J437_LFUL008677 [Ladona fulva]
MVSVRALHISLLFYAIAESHGFIKTAMTYYQVAHRYTCSKTYLILYERPLLFNYGETYYHGYHFEPTFACEMHVKTKSKNSGIIAAVQRLKIRRADPNKCLDFMKYNVDQTQRCGEIHNGMVFSGEKKFHPPNDFISLYSGPFSYGSSVSSEFVPAGNVVLPGNHLVTYFNINKNALQFREELKIHIAYTAYKDCDENNVTKGWFNCGYGVCISERLVYDGVVNCPFGDCIDEGGCDENNRGYPQLTGTFLRNKAVANAVQRAGPPYPLLRSPPPKMERSATKVKLETVCLEPLIGPRDRNRPGRRTRSRPHHPKLDDVDLDEFFLKVYLNLLEKMKDKDIVKNQKKFVKRVSDYLMRTHVDMWNNSRTVLKCGTVSEDSECSRMFKVNM